MRRRERRGTRKTGALEIGWKREEEEGEEGQRTSEIFNIAESSRLKIWLEPFLPLFPFVLTTLHPPFPLFLLATS